jgi:hypothetical protein
MKRPTPERNTLHERRFTHRRRFTRKSSGSAIAAEALSSNAGRTPPGTTVDVGVMLRFSLVVVNESVPGASVLSRR